MSIRLYVGNLPKEIDRKELQAVFADFGDSVTAKVITDRKTGKCRGFGFVTVKTDEEADQLIEKYNGHIFQENPLKIEKALPRSKGKGAEKGEKPAEKTGEEESRPTPAPTTKAAEKSSGGGGGGGGGGSSSRRGSNKSRRGGGSSSSSTTTSGGNQSDSIQPDPRWAHELEKLKQMLAAQANP